MSIEYLVNDKKYGLSYADLKERYQVFCMMSDQEFLKNIPAAAHLACVICYLKEIPTYIALCDEGVIHELMHLLDIENYDKDHLREIRKSFELWLKLA